MKNFLKQFCFIISLFAIVICGCDDSLQILTDDSSSPETEHRAKTIRVPSDASSIQNGINQAGFLDTILVADGEYVGYNNSDLDFLGKTIILKSENGAGKTFIDCQGNSTSQHRGFTFHNNETDSAIVDGFTILGGYIGNGGAVYCLNSSPTIKNCVFIGNHATASGGAIWCKSAQPKFINCTIVKNSSMAGSALFVSAEATPILENCIIAYNTESRSVFVRTNNFPEFLCSNIFGNPGGDWSDEIENQQDINNNLEVDPQFCDMISNNYQLQESSICTAENNSCKTLIGALGSNCN